MSCQLLIGHQVVELIPQRPPMVMVDTFYGITNRTSRSGLSIAANNIFCADGLFREPGIIEHIAQSAAARVGFIFKQKNEPVPLGFIGSIDKLTISDLPVVGDQLTTEITVLQEVMGITLIHARTTAGNRAIAECKMKIFLKTD